MPAPARPRIAQLVETNPGGWSGPVKGRVLGSPWAIEHGYAGEDWNFAIGDSVDGYLYGYGQGRLREGRGKRFDVFFFLRERAGTFRAVGFYLNAEVLSPSEARSAWRKLAKAGVLDRRADQIKALDLSDPKASANGYLTLEEEPIRWRVRLEDVRVLDALPEISPLRPTDWRYSNAYDYSEWESWDETLKKSRPLVAVAQVLPVRPRLHRLHLERYRAFTVADLELAPLTFIIGRNNAGKSALCRAPWIFSRPWLKDARLPVPMRSEGLEIGGTLRDLIHDGAQSGVGVKAFFSGMAALEELDFGLTYLPEAGDRQQLTHLRFVPEGAKTPLELPGWPQSRAMISERPDLSDLAESIALILGLRDPPGRREQWDGFPPENIGFNGKGAYGIWAGAEERGDSAALQLFRQWFERILLSTPEMKLSGGIMMPYATHLETGRRAHLLDSGAGLIQALPLIVSLTLVAPEKQPSLYCLEQPELHLHPRAHGELAELLTEAALKRNGPWFLVETHSDALLLRIRALLAEEVLKPEDVLLYSVEDNTHGASQLKPIRFNNRGTPDWWPKGVFSEPQEEFLRIRRALKSRDARV